MSLNRPRRVVAGILLCAILLWYLGWFPTLFWYLGGSRNDQDLALNAVADPAPDAEAVPPDAETSGTAEQQSAPASVLSTLTGGLLGGGSSSPTSPQDATATDLPFGETLFSRELPQFGQRCFRTRVHSQKSVEVAVLGMIGNPNVAASFGAPTTPGAQPAQFGSFTILKLDVPPASQERGGEDLFTCVTTFSGQGADFTVAVSGGTTRMKLGFPAIGRVDAKAEGEASSPKRWFLAETGAHAAVNSFSGQVDARVYEASSSSSCGPLTTTSSKEIARAAGTADLHLDLSASTTPFVCIGVEASASPGETAAETTMPGGEDHAGRKEADVDALFLVAVSSPPNTSTLLLAPHALPLAMEIRPEKSETFSVPAAKESDEDAVMYCAEEIACYYKPRTAVSFGILSDFARRIFLYAKYADGTPIAHGRHSHSAERTHVGYTLHLAELDPKKDTQIKLRVCWSPHSPKPDVVALDGQAPASDEDDVGTRGAIALTQETPTSVPFSLTVASASEITTLAPGVEAEGVSSEGSPGKWRDYRIFVPSASKRSSGSYTTLTIQARGQALERSSDDAPAAASVSGEGAGVLSAVTELVAEAESAAKTMVEKATGSDTAASSTPQPTAFTYLVADRTHFAHDPRAYRWSSGPKKEAGADAAIRLTTDPALAAADPQLMFLDCPRLSPCYVYVSVYAWVPRRAVQDGAVLKKASFGLSATMTHMLGRIQENEKTEQTLMRGQAQLFHYRVREPGKSRSGGGQADVVLADVSVMFVIAGDE